MRPFYLTTSYDQEVLGQWNDEFYELQDDRPILGVDPIREARVQQLLRGPLYQVANLPTSQEMN